MLFVFSSPRATAITAAACVLLGASASAQAANDSRLFEKLAGSWSGTGTVAVAGGADERVRCQADYSPSSPSQLRLAFRLASDAYNLQVSSDVVRQGDQITGTWTESTTGVSGDLSGTAGADRIEATAEGAGFSAHLSIALRGKSQDVQLTSQGTTASTASVTLKRE